MNQEIINEIFEYWYQINSQPETELDYINEYTLLVAVVLSAQATDVGVNKATKSLFEKVRTPQEMLDLGEDNLKNHIKTIGLFNNKAKNVILLSQQLLERHDGKIPDNSKALEALAGVGVKTAAVVLNCLFAHPRIAVDTHVFRVSNRLGLVKTTKAEKTEAELLKVIPTKWLQHAHHWLILHGRYICKARKPECEKCDITHLCEYYNQ